jgi:hypothetical protein
MNLADSYEDAARQTASSMKRIAIRLGILWKCHTVLPDFGQSDVCDWNNSVFRRNCRNCRSPRHSLEDY